MPDTPKKIVNEADAIALLVKAASGVGAPFIEIPEQLAKNNTLASRRGIERTPKSVELLGRLGAAPGNKGRYILDFNIAEAKEKFASAAVQEFVSRTSALNDELYAHPASILSLSHDSLTGLNEFFDGQRQQIEEVSQAAALLGVPMGKVMEKIKQETGDTQTAVVLSLFNPDPQKRGEPAKSGRIGKA